MAGFTLVELLVTVAVVAILTTLATAGYRQYLRRANRADATTALLRIASAQEKHYLQNGRYASGDELPAAPPAGLGIPRTERGYYRLAVEIPDGDAASGFLATATVQPGAAQADDHDCWVFAIDAQGRRSARTHDGGSGAEVTDRCWR